MSQLDQLNSRADQVVSAFTAAKGKLYRPDGSPIYADNETRGLTAALLTEATQQLAALEAEAESLLAQAERDTLPVDDLTAHLTAGEIAQASGRATLVALEAGRLSMAEVLQRCEQALRGEDRVSTLVWMNVAAGRINQTDEQIRKNLAVGFDDRPVFGSSPAPALSAADALAMGNLRPLVDQMREALVPADVRKRAEAAKATLEGAQAFKRRAAQLRDELNGSTARFRAQVTREYREAF